MRKIRSALALFLAVFAAQASFGYEVWFGLPYIPKGSHDELKDQWDIVAEKLEGMNTNNVDTQRASADKNTAAEWKAIVQCMPTAKTNAVLEFPRTHFQYDGFGGAGKDPLPDALVTKFKKETKLGCQINWVMAFDNQPGEDRTLPVEEWSDLDLENLRDWLDNNGHADVRIITTVRNNGSRSRSFSKKAIVEGVSIEAKAELWFENNGSRQDYLLWALSEPLVKDKHFKFQVPYNRNGSDSGYKGMREFMRWLSTPAMLGSTDFIRRDDVAFMVITYSDIFPLLPETSADGTRYQDTLFSTALSIIEQRDLFEGRGPGGLISLEQALSHDRFEVTSTPITGLVAHWPLDEGSGTSTADASGFGSDAALLNGVSWGSDATRGSHVVFDGTNDRIATAFTYALTGTDDFTWAWWAKKEPGSHSGSIMVGNRYGGTGSESLEFIKFMSSKAAFANTGSAASIEDYIYPNEVATSSWNHYAMVKQGTSYQWYVDGVAQGSPVTINYNETSALPFLIGGDDDGSGTKVNEHFKGAIDDVVLYRSALSSAEVTDVMGGSYALTIPMAAAALGGPVNLVDGSTWEDGLPPHAGYNYLVPNTGNLRGETGTAIFPGYSLTVEAGGRFQVRAIEGSGELTTVGHLILKGGASYGAGGFAEVTAGTGSSSTNVLDGTITNSGHTRFLSFGNSGGSTIARSLKVLSWIEGSGRIQTMEGSAARLSSITIANSANTFSGTWEVAAGSRLIFDKAGAVGDADVEVATGGFLEIKGNWNTGASLVVSNLPDTEIKVGSYAWKISAVQIGASAIPDGVYTVAELNSLAGSSVFSGNGTIIVGTGLPGGPVAHWRLDEGTGTTAIDSSGGGNAGTLLHGATWASDGTRDSFVSFDGTDDRISTTFGYALASSDDFTWTWWAKADAGASSGSIMVGNRYDGGGAESLEFIKFMPQKVTLVNGGLDDREDYNYADITNSGWHHYAMVKTATSYQWYVDGVAQGDPVTINYSESDVIPLNIGGDDDDATPGGREGEHFKGSIDDVALYGRALTQSEITGVFNGVYGNFSQTTAQEDWRQLHFGSTANTGSAADAFDSNNDGENNLIEFATGQNPHANTRASTSLGLDGGTLVFRYTRSKAALAAGVTFSVQWSDTLLPGSWSSAGVTETVDPTNPGGSEFDDIVATVPADSDRRFYRLDIIAP